MGKYILFIVVALIIGGGIWFYRLGGPAQLDLADRWWPGKTEFSGHVQKGSLNYDAYLPKGAGDDFPVHCGSRSHPTMIFFYGGSWRDGDRKSYGFVGRAFAARGFVTYVVDYRKAPQHRFPAFIKDAAAFIAKVREEPCNNPEKLYVMGHSAGAHIAAMVALDPQWLAAHGTDPSIIAGFIGLAGPYDFLPFTTDAARDALGRWPNPQETQPINYVRGNAPPMLLLTGDIDDTVKPRNSRALAEAITAKGGKAEVKIYPKVDHADIVMAISRAFRKKAPVIDDVMAFTKSVSQPFPSPKQSSR